MSVTRDTTPAQVIEWWRDRECSELSYESALRILSAINGNELEHQIHQFSLLPSYAQHILTLDLQALVHMKTVSQRLSSLFIAPSRMRQAWQHLRPFIAVDAAFTKTLHEYVLVLAADSVANEEGINLACGITLREDTVHWDWSMRSLGEAFEGLNERNTVTMSDRQKGLAIAVAAELEGATRACCCKHIERNLVKLWGEEIRAACWEVVKGQGVGRLR